ncbi:GAF and ANTAR domain-containing protein [Microbacterium sp. cx-55]|uniref:GAF and ANTAR domain-containing protein n=1 Tax=Microbacterium sp. cx-55 TaxID=2875948 RepID=UPI001CBAD66C|nr:GAF and ANTAR domain-containing protein [Microbacterium sp. cx-55]MBZ4487362.1 GAF and ANTAR domain-containing protein [Microbacterium sp. cx-55]UGB35382.1 GAF and ANTAR domain-containing protein [Microbacterium sp. cx-55]
MPHSRESRLVETFVTLTDSLVADYDVVDVLQTLVDRAVELFDAAAGAIHLADKNNVLQVVASTSERSSFIGLLQLNAGEGPCITAVTTGRLVTAESADELRRHWPRFAEASKERGYAGVHAIPLRLRDTTVGSLNLFRETEGALNGADARAAQALADVATISLLQQRTIRNATLAAEQLQHALDSRVAIEQAKGYLARAAGVDMDTAFRMIRQYARSRQERLSDVAAAVARDEMPLSELVADGAF